eukprot:TRINITY_DN14220_c0_g1_i1.p1 TRINITY_DN14220_c0_g1~~TRINITY_DN14220_c0_g1_i1.p1  ORF type:complete len:321 (+),score=52.09 TRINITY_DN14220_c0_g1_i1:85-1047(+)
MQGIFNAMVKIASLKHRLFGKKGHPASPEARAVVGIINTMTGMIFPKDASIAEFRVKTEEFGRKVGPPKGTKVTELNCSGTRALFCETKGSDAANGPIVLHFHGGGYVTGSCYSVQGSILPILARFPCVGVIVDFGLAPEKTPDDARQDGVNVYKYLIEEMKIDPARIVIMGESAGGGLCIRVAQAIQASGLPSPACVVSWSPWLDMTLSYLNHPHEDVTTPALMERIKATIKPECLKSCSPMYEDPTGLPPLFLSGGGYELMAEEIAAYAAKCRSAGVDLTYELLPGLFHTFQLQAACPEGAATQKATWEFIKKYTKRG